MPRQPPSARRPSSADDTAQTSTPQSDKPQKIQLGDTPAMKHALDSGILEVLKEAGYAEDFKLGAAKLLLGLAAIACAGAAHLLPGKLAAHWWSLLACVVGYGACNVAAMVLSAVLERDIVIFTHANKDNGVKLEVVTTLPRFSDEYTIKIAAVARDGKRSTAQVMHSVTKYFHEDGYMSEAALRPHVLRLVADALKPFQ